MTFFTFFCLTQELISSKDVFGHNLKYKSGEITTTFAEQRQRAEAQFWIYLKSNSKHT